ncbi:MAG TPA: hypothetical protein VFT60_07365, partial [Bryobacteraceae bacterium]|nr:hypothetical protein [Bryobacteraceae bacterium]
MSQELVTQILNIASIKLDGGTQCRVSVDKELICEYAALMRAGVHFPPIRVWFDGSSYWLSDGFQRLSAAIAIGRDTITADVQLGALEDARWDSCSSNASHGARRTKPDVDNAIRKALAHPNSTHLSNVQIAK